MKNMIIKSLFEDNYIYPTIIYNLVKNNCLDYYIDYLNKEDQYITINEKKVLYYHNFLRILDNFIDFFDSSLNISHSQILCILENVLAGQTNTIFLQKIDVKENDYIHNVIKEYKKIILFHFRKNLNYVISVDNEIKLNFDNMNININSDKDLYNLLIDCSNARKNHQYILFDDFNEYLDNKNTFYLYMWKILFTKIQ